MRSVSRLEFPKILALAALQGVVGGLAALSYDRGHRAAALLLALALPFAVGYVGRRVLALPLPATALSYAVLPLLGAAILRGVPWLVLRASVPVILLALGPTGLGWWLGGRVGPIRRGNR